MSNRLQMLLTARLSCALSEIPWAAALDRIAVAGTISVVDSFFGSGACAPNYQ